MIFPATPKSVTFSGDDLVAFLLADHSDHTLMPLGAALPSAELLPGIKLARIMAAIGRRLGPNSIGYDMSRGHETLRCELSRRSLDWGCALSADDFMVTVGATEAVSLALRVICKPGDTVAVESPTYFGLASMLRELQLKALPISRAQRRRHGSGRIGKDAAQNPRCRLRGHPKFPQPHRLRHARPRANF